MYVSVIVTQSLEANPRPKVETGDVPGTACQICIVDVVACSHVSVMIMRYLVVLASKL
jgi:hypothetical protein